MSSSEVLDSSLRIYQRFGLSFLRLSVAPALLCLGAVGFVTNYALSGFFTTNATNGAGQMILEASTALLLAIFVGGPMFLIGVSYTSSLVIHVVSDYLLGGIPDPDAAAAAARAELPRLFAVNLKELCLSISGFVIAAAVMALGGYLSGVTSDSEAVAGIIGFIGLIGIVLGVVVFLIVIALDAVAAPVAILEGIGARRATKRSRSLLKAAGYHQTGTGTIWALYLMLLFVGCVLIGGITLFSNMIELPATLENMLSFLPAEQLFLQAIYLLPSFFVLWTLTPVWATVITIVYYDRRIRLEGFDIDALAAEIPHSKPAIGSRR